METHINTIDLTYFSPLLLLLVLFAILFLYGKQSKRKSGPNLPPGSMGWPFMGETLAYLQKHPSFSLGHYMNNHISRYGKIFKSNILGAPAIISADGRFNRFILQNEGRLFVASYPESYVRIFGEERAFIKLTGERHKEERSVILKFLPSDMLRARLLPDIEHFALLIINTWKDGLSLSVKKEARKFAYYTIAKTILSMEPGMPETEKMRREYSTLNQRAASMPLNFPGTLYWKALKSRSEIYREIERKMDSRMMEMIRQGDMKGNNDMLSWCLTETMLSREHMLDLLLGTLFASQEAPTIALSLAIFFLGHFPNAFQELRDEHLTIARKKTERGETKLNWEDYKQMVFTECVVNESMRLGNITKFVPRKAIQDVRYEGYDIPRGWKVFPVLSAVNLDGSIYKDPQQFDPWRWQNKSRSTVEFTPFGGGSRYCPGAELAKLELAVFLHHFVLNYIWELVKHDEPLAFPYVEFVDGLPIQVFKIDKQAYVNIVTVE